MSNSIICDYFKFTIPRDESPLFRDELSIFLASSVFEKSTDDLYRIHGGTIKLGYMGQVMTCGISGQSMDYLRSSGLLEGLLAPIFGFSHRVTLIDATLDLLGVKSSLELQKIYDESKKGLHRLTRKAIDPQKHLKKFFSPGLDGVDTGTIYLGKAGTTEVYAKVYDKRKERFDNTGKDIGYECLRYEVSVTGKLSPTLKDVWDPTGLFWRFMGQTLLPLPKDKDWVGRSEGYILPKRVPLEPYEALLNKIELRSPELREFARIAALGGKVGCNRLLKEIESLCSMELSSISKSENKVIPIESKLRR